MIHSKYTSKKGFIKLIILIIVALVILKFAFNINLSDIIHSTIVQDLWSILKQLLALLWQAILLTLQFIKLAIIKAQEFLNSISVSTKK